MHSSKIDQVFSWKTAPEYKKSRTINIQSDPIIIIITQLLLRPRVKRELSQNKAKRAITLITLDTRIIDCAQVEDRKRH